MPILAKQPSVFPADLLSVSPSPQFPGEGASSAVGDRAWWAIHTKARQEKRLAEQLLRYEIPFYLPLVKRNHIGHGRTRQSHVPVFTGYVFLLANQEERLRCLTTNRVSQMLPVHDPAELYRDLVQVERLIQSDMPLTIESRIQPGQRVRIRHGVLAGMEGTVTSRKRHTRLVVAVNFLRQGVSVELDDFLLEPI